MHSTVVRVQNTFGFFTTVAFVTAILTATSVVFLPQSPSASIEPVLRNLQVVKGRPNYYSTKKEEYAHIKFDLDADLTSLFHWNTKQIFVWITATYPSSGSQADSPPSQAVIWDSIINSRSQVHPFNPTKYLNWNTPPAQKSRNPQRLKKKDETETGPEPGIIRLKNSKPKYQITDISSVISERQNVTLDMGWNVQPWVGALTWTMNEDHSFGIWQGLAGGRSQSFSMPALKGKAATAETVVAKKETPEAAAASGVL